MAANGKVAKATEQAIVLNLSRQEAEFALIVLQRVSLPEAFAKMLAASIQTQLEEKLAQEA